jgi:predicted SprT family Zn-dependent metalloprotease
MAQSCHQWVSRRERIETAGKKRWRFVCAKCGGFLGQILRIIQNGP